MKLLFYINAIHDGGAERVMINLTKQFASSGHNVVLVTSFVDQWEYPVDEKVRRLSLEREEIPRNRIARNLSRICKLRKICKEEQPDAVISFMAEPNFRMLLATIGLPAKTIVSVRNDPNREYAGKLGYLVGKYILPMADGCVFQTEQAKAWFPKRLQKKSAIIMNAVDEGFYAVQRQGGKDVVTLGRLTGQKNQAMLIRAFSGIANKYPEWNLRIYGQGEQQIPLQQLIQNLGMEQRIYLMGATSQVPQILGNAGVFVFPSDYEGMPNALLEAMAVGVPSISTDCPCGGPAMVIRHGENGLLIPVGDEQALKNALDSLLAEPKKAEKLGEQAKLDAQSFRPEKVFKLWTEYVQKVANGN